MYFSIFVLCVSKLKIKREKYFFFVLKSFSSDQHYAGEDVKLLFDTVKVVLNDLDKLEGRSYYGGLRRQMGG